MKVINAYWTRVIFKKAGFRSSKQVFTLLENTDEKCFSENNLVPKNDFIQNLKSMFESIEQTGDSLRETRDMLGPGSIFENAFPGQYGSLRASYISERKKLEKQLYLIKFLFTN